MRNQLEVFNATNPNELPPAVRRVLDAVRRRIRAYIWLEGLASLVVLMGMAFWIGLAVDWMFEPSWRVRQIALMALATLAAYVAYRSLWRRIRVPVSDPTVATLLERRFPHLNEHLVTAVDVVAAKDRITALHPALVDQTKQAAAKAVATVRPSEVLNWGPLVRVVAAAGILGLSIVLFALVSRDSFAFWLSRIALSEELWPRRVLLEVVGIPADATGQRVHKLAQDDDYELEVLAHTKGFEVPDEVQIRFRLADGRRGRDTMVRVGEAQPGRDDFQVFRYQFKRVTADMEFDVVGGDDRVRGLKLQVVDRPELLAIEFECLYPSYLQRATRSLPVTGGMRIPEGTQLTLHARATKPLVAARIHRSNIKQDVQLEFPLFGGKPGTSPGTQAKISPHAGMEDERTTMGKPATELRWEYGTLTEDDVLLVSVTDSDGVSSREPYRISLSALRDEVPQIAVRLSGIGPAITPEAVVPVVGKITDDYGLDRAWFEYQVDGGDVATRPLGEQPRGEPLLSRLGPFDLRETDPASGKRVLELGPGQKLTLRIKASDRFNLSDQPRFGSSQPFVLDIVTPSDLLAQLERRELTLRQRYEAIYEKMTEMRDLMTRVNFDEVEGSAPEATEEASESPVSSNQRELARRRLRVGRALQDVNQSTDEISGVAEGFDDLGQQLVNNRIDNPDLRSRLVEQIAQPLHRIVSQRMPQLSGQLKLVEQHVADPAVGKPALDKSLTLADGILVEMKQVLDRMLELETYNEVVALLRDIISEQNEINRRTKERQKERLRELFDEE